MSIPPCWDVETARLAMDTEALQIPDEMFLATHLPPTNLLRVDFDGVSNPRPLTEKALLQEFIDPKKQHVFAVVQGDPGVGKSHLVRWMASQIDPSRRPVLVRAVHTSLRHVISQLLGELQGPTIARIRDALASASDPPDEESGRRQILDALTEVIEGGRFESGRDVSLAKRLPLIFRDPVFRPQFLAPGRIVDQLRVHARSTERERDRREARRTFTASDFQIDLGNLVDAAKEAQAAAKGLATERARNDAADFVNQLLDRALSRVLRLDGISLVDAMSDVRRALAKERRELILLIEDLSVAEGVDRQLLLALKVEPNQGDAEPLCVLRSIVGVTPGYYSKLEDTYKQRVTIPVRLDGDTLKDAGAIEQKAELRRFGARYLNAVRYSPDELHAWKSLRGEALENRCEKCPHGEVVSATCRAAFGDVDGVGLFPFTDAAFRTALIAKVPGGKTFALNPRIFVRDVLRHVLVTHQSAFAQGKFPPPDFGAHFGNPVVPGAFNRDAKARFGEHVAAQLNAVVSIYGDKVPSAVTQGVFEALGLPDPCQRDRHNTGKDESGDDPPPPVPPTPPPPPLTPPAPPRAAAPELLAIEEWRARKRKLRDTVVNPLRSLVVDAILGWIDWDVEMLNRKRAEDHFENMSVNFEDMQQLPRGGKNLVQITIAQNDENALALQALFAAKQAGVWSAVPDSGLTALDGALEVSHFLDTHAVLVVQQIRQLQAEPEGWDPVGAVVELLAMGARFANRAPDNVTTERLLEVMLTPSRPNMTNRSPVWQRIWSTFAENRDELVAILSDRANCAKGSSMQTLMLDLVRVEPVLDELRKTWRPSRTIPAKLQLREAWQPIATVRDAFDKLLDKAIDEEHARHTSWIVWADALVGMGSTGQSLKVGIEAALDAAEAKQYARGGVTDKLRIELRDHFSPGAFDELRVVLRALAAASTPKDRLRVVAKDLSGQMNVAGGLLKYAETFLGSTEKHLREIEANLGTPTEERLDAVTKETRDLIAKLGALGTELKGERS